MARSSKARFSFSQDGARFRANYGHSVEVDLEMESLKPPARLFHGTASRFIAQIQGQGLLPKGRQMVHLSGDRETASELGSRHGIPLVLSIYAARMENDGHHFFQPASGIWLIPAVPPEYIEFP